MKNEDKLNIMRPFGPSIGTATIPKTLIDKINNFIDEISKDKNKSKEFDAGKNLVGQVSQEIYLPQELINKELVNFLAVITKTFVENTTNEKVTKFNLLKVWVVRQFKNEYNPVHWHRGHISGAGYLKLPKDFGQINHSKKNQEFNGKINFIHGSKQFLSKSIISRIPEVGKMYVFPNYLMHSVNPFYGEGERRSISFNAMIDDNVYDVYSGKT
jgi:uncharacterized protein (TIGR02466 family)